MGVSENSVPLNPMVNDHYPYYMAIIGKYWEYTLFSDKPIYNWLMVSKIFFFSIIENWDNPAH